MKDLAFLAQRSNNSMLRKGQRLLRFAPAAVWKQGWVVHSQHVGRGDKVLSLHDPKLLYETGECADKRFMRRVCPFSTRRKRITRSPALSGAGC